MQENTVGSMILMNQTGDVTISWNDENKKAIIKIIKKKLKEGYTFFVMEERKGLAKVLPKKKVKVTSHKDLSKADAIIMDSKVAQEVLTKVHTGDEDFDKLGNINKVDVAKTKMQSGTVETTKVSRDPEEIASSKTIATRPVYSG